MQREVLDLQVLQAAQDLQERLAQLELPELLEQLDSLVPPDQPGQLVVLD